MLPEAPAPNPAGNQTLIAAIVSRPGMLQQSLRASLAACSGVTVLATLGDGLSALNYVMAHPPALLVVDCNLLDEEVAALLAAIRGRQAATRSLVLTRSARQVPWALAAGADAALPRDGPHQELLAVLAQFGCARP